MIHLRLSVTSYLAKSLPTSTAAPGAMALCILNALMLLIMLSSRLMECCSTTKRFMSDIIFLARSARRHLRLIVYSFGFVRSASQSSTK